ncbi:putative het domain-containing protein [Botrytis fragariae]|uniref:Putative het domain-containing protein n=1 Tax=Botrytis fragariae TaxID=1964551 RepID=A0A8H6ASP1_9HELO|nr:putative het domain-containing protein [Botrytis fragariae]KAF5873086.1 putative het domain-containing protein [Botrytis fragariae]
MAAIFSHSYLNIAATGANDSRGGCFNIRCLKQLSFKLGTKSHPITDQYRNIDWGIRVRPSFESVHHRYNSRVISETDLLDKINTPLLSRAWVFQERQLAPRTLHFHPSELVMECKSGLRCECTVLEILNEGSGSNLKDQDSLGSEAYEIFNEWNELVREYSQLLITRESDRSIALIGIATEFQKKVNCGYLAGLWSSDIANGLLWDINGSPYMRERMDLKRIEEPFAPNWSWASLVQGVGTFTTSVVFQPGQVLTPHEDFK